MPTATGFFGSDSFTYYDTDSYATSNVATVYITVYSVPVAYDDRYTVVGDTTLTVSAVNGVLANDFTANGNPLTVVLQTGPAHGTLVLNGDGSFSYTPNAGFNGMDGFTYYDTNGPATSNVATVYITVYAGSDRL